MWVRRLNPFPFPKESDPASLQVKVCSVVLPPAEMSLAGVERGTRAYLSTQAGSAPSCAGRVLPRVPLLLLIRQTPQFLSSPNTLLLESSSPQVSAGNDARRGFTAVTHRALLQSLLLAAGFALPPAPRVLITHF